MSLKFIRVFVSSLRQHLPRQNNLLSGFQIRTITAMEVAPVDKKDNLVQDKNRTRYKRRRQWDDRKENGESQEKKTCDKPFERIKRKKMAMLLGYCGVDYYGMQRNPGVPTIEEDLLKALYEAKYITEDDFNNQQNAQFQRSSRTDKGVSAARQVVTYSYTLPTYVFESNVASEDERKAYRITSQKIDQVNEVLGYYKGTKSYHNFTEKKHFQDPSSLRYMMSFVLERVFMESEMEFAELLVKGQSFMLHQIRKMIGLMIAVVRGHTDISTLEKSFGKEKVMIPTAPGLGLVLDK
ncbi:Pseudouridine synthase, partial [Danaus plexippus plexippus]